MTIAAYVVLAVPNLEASAACCRDALGFTVHILVGLPTA